MRRVFPLLLATQFVLVASPHALSKAGATVLLIVAHPDDEYEVAGTAYRIAKELGGTVDELIVTDGQAGYHYSSLAAAYYGVDLTDEAVGRARLPHIRHEEARAAARVLGIRHQWFLGEKDDRFTLDSEEVLRHSWDAHRVSRVLQQRLREGQYDFVFLLLPSADTHGEHKAASILALKAVLSFPEAQRPIVLGALSGGADALSYQALPAYPITATVSSTPSFRFDRDQRFGYEDSLSYQIVVDWLIAEHKSQGLLQTRCQQDRYENFWLFTLNRASAESEAKSLFVAIAPQTGAARTFPLEPATSSLKAYTPRHAEGGLQ